jgi:hypothetical protein
MFDSSELTDVLRALKDVSRLLKPQEARGFNRRRSFS